MVGALSIDKIALTQKVLATFAVKAFVHIFIDIAFSQHLAEYFLHHFLVARLSSPNEVIVRNKQSLPGLLESASHFINEILRRFAFCLGCFLNLRAVLVNSGEEKYVTTSQA